MAPTAPTTSVDVLFAVDNDAVGGGAEATLCAEDRYEIFGTMRVSFDVFTLAKGY